MKMSIEEDINQIMLQYPDITGLPEFSGEIPPTIQIASALILMMLRHCSHTPEPMDYVLSGLGVGIVLALHYPQWAKTVLDIEDNAFGIDQSIIDSYQNSRMELVKHFVECQKIRNGLPCNCKEVK